MPKNNLLSDETRDLLECWHSSFFCLFLSGFDRSYAHSPAASGKTNHNKSLCHSYFAVATSENSSFVLSYSCHLENPTHFHISCDYEQPLLPKSFVKKGFRSCRLFHAMLNLARTEQLPCQFTHMRKDMKCMLSSLTRSPWWFLFCSLTHVSLHFLFFFLCAHTGTIQDCTDKKERTKKKNIVSAFSVDFTILLTFLFTENGSTFMIIVNTSGRENSATSTNQNYFLNDAAASVRCASFKKKNHKMTHLIGFRTPTTHTSMNTRN